MVHGKVSCVEQYGEGHRFSCSCANDNISSAEVPCVEPHVGTAHRVAQELVVFCSCPANDERPAVYFVMKAGVRLVVLLLWGGIVAEHLLNFQLVLFVEHVLVFGVER